MVLKMSVVFLLPLPPQCQKRSLPFFDLRVTSLGFTTLGDKHISSLASEHTFFSYSIPCQQISNYSHFKRESHPIFLLSKHVVLGLACSKFRTRV